MMHWFLGLEAIGPDVEVTVSDGEEGAGPGPFATWGQKPGLFLA
jgi:hypothetical protein